MGHSPDYYRGIFDPDKTNLRWQQTASAVSYIRAGSPPFLVMVGAAEDKAMISQSVRLHEALQARGVPSTLRKIPWQSHGRIVLTLSRPDQTSGPAVVEFIRHQSGKKPPLDHRDRPAPFASGPATI
jgi:acetyl esterase/lipase